MKYFFYSLVGLFFTISIVGSNYVDQVDMFMGNQGSSNCVIGPQLPHGSVNPSPQTPNGENDGYDPTQPIRGFAQLHVSGTGWGRYGQILISPQVGFNPHETGHDSNKSEEEATPYYYKVNLLRYGIKTEITPTHHAVAYRFTFSEGKEKNILIDVAHNLPQHIKPEIGGKFHGGEIEFDSNSQIISGWGEYSGGFGSNLPYRVYFTTKINEKVEKVEIINKKDSALYVKIILPPATKEINLGVGVSMKNNINSKKYLNEEIGNLYFDEIKERAKNIWNETLSKIEIKGGATKDRKIFYTSLYHSFLMPRDRTEDNPWWDSNAPHLDDHYCVWDTWRTKYPLMVLINESFVSKTINSFIDRFANNQLCRPTFTSALDSKNKQGGDDVDNIISDAIAKGVKGFDMLKAYELMKFNAFQERSSSYIQYGWQPEIGEKMSCSSALEYAYNDYCAASVAKKTGDLENSKFLRERSMSWKMLYNTGLKSNGFKGFIAPRKINKEWISIDPAKGYGSWVEYFYEGNSWTYSLFTPHCFDDLIKLSGGKKTMVNRLSYGFDNKLIDLSNEPGFLAPFIFIHCDRSDLTDKYVSSIRKNNFTLEGGYPDNEDSGAMGSWYVFTSMGLFPNAGQDFYYLIAPSFSEVVVRMENGNQISVRAPKLTSDKKYIESVELNGEKLNRAWIKHSEIADGAELVFNMTSKRVNWAGNGNGMYEDK